MIWWWLDGDLKGFSLDLWWFNGDCFPDLDSAPPGHVVVQTSPRRAPSSQEMSQIRGWGFVPLNFGTDTTQSRIAHRS